MLKSCLLSLDKVNWLIRDSCHSCAFEGPQINSLSHCLSTKFQAKTVFMLFEVFVLPNSSLSSKHQSIHHHLWTTKTNLTWSNRGCILDPLDFTGRIRNTNNNDSHSHSIFYSQSRLPCSMRWNMVLPSRNRTSLILRFWYLNYTPNHTSCILVMTSIFVAMNINYLVHRDEFAQSLAN